jgi:endonuclease/exonuclease/phosphatase family metal-dependent hydrolase
MLTITTLNLLNDLTFWEERAPLIVRNLAELSPDLIAFQEVALPENNAVWLADQLDGYSVYFCPFTNKRGCCEGLAILTRLPIDKHDTMPLLAQNRVAHRVIFHLGSHRWSLINTHLFWSPFDDPIRTGQVERILKWIPHHLHTIVCGDFNAMPHYRSIKAIKHRLTSAYEASHGREPDYTFQTPLKRGPGLRHAARRAALQVVGQITNAPCPSWCGTIDYIFVSHPIQVIDCQVSFDQASITDPEIYPSDHLGLTAKLTLPET